MLAKETSARLPNSAMATMWAQGNLKKKKNWFFFGGRTICVLEQY